MGVYERSRSVVMTEALLLIVLLAVAFLLLVNIFGPVGILVGLVCCGAVVLFTSIVCSLAYN
jgi:hypothetical protein